MWFVATSEGVLRSMWYLNQSSGNRPIRRTYWNIVRTKTPLRLHKNCDETQHIFSNKAMLRNKVLVNTPFDFRPFCGQFTIKVGRCSELQSTYSWSKCIYPVFQLQFLYYLEHLFSLFTDKSTIKLIQNIV